MILEKAWLRSTIITRDNEPNSNKNPPVIDVQKKSLVVKLCEVFDIRYCRIQLNTLWEVLIRRSQFVIYFKINKWKEGLAWYA